MLRIAPDAAVATILTLRHLGHPGSAAVSGIAGQAAGGVILVAMVVIGVFLRTVAMAARGLAAVVGQFVRLATAMTSAVVLMVVVVLAAVVLLAHH